MNQNDDHENDRNAEPPLTPADEYNRAQWRKIWRIYNVNQVVGFIWLVAIVVGIIIIYF